MPTVDCDWCGKSFHLRPSRATGPHLFCCKRCFYDWTHATKTVELVCDECGKPFRRKQALAASKRTYCSLKCLRSSQKKHSSRIAKTCETCGKTFFVWPSTDHYTATRFCSQKCAGNEKPWAQLVCQQCGKPFKVIASRADTARFCSMECRHAWDSQNKCGQNNHNWQGGPISDYGHNWARQRKRAIKRDRVCQICGATHSPHSRALSVHHIRPIREYADKRRANFLANLVTLCEPCHRDVHNGKAELP